MEYMRSEILKLIITAVILESIIYIYGTYDPLGSENIHMLFINPVIYGVIPVIIYYFYKNRWITGKCNEIKSIVITALFLTVKAFWLFQDLLGQATYKHNSFKYIKIAHLFYF